MSDKCIHAKNDLNLLADAVRHMEQAVDALRRLELAADGPASEMARIAERSGEVSSMATVILSSLRTMKEDLAERTIQHARGCTWHEAIMIRQGRQPSQPAQS
jgi:hypothetical protein